MKKQPKEGRKSERKNERQMETKSKSKVNEYLHRVVHRRPMSGCQKVREDRVAVKVGHLWIELEDGRLGNEI